MFRQALVRSLRDPKFSVNNDSKSFFEMVFKRPLLKSNQGPYLASLIFVIDGLDECDECDFIAGCLALMVSEASWLKVIVTSREQPEIRRAFDQIHLKKEYNLFKDNVRGDIGRVLDFEFGPNGRLAGINSFYDR